MTEAVVVEEEVDEEQQISEEVCDLFCRFWDLPFLMKTPHKARTFE